MLLSFMRVAAWLLRSRIALFLLGTLYICFSVTFFLEYLPWFTSSTTEEYDEFHGIVADGLRKRPVVRVAIVVCRKRAGQAIVMLKSMVLTTKHFLHVYIVGEEGPQKEIMNEIAKWSAYQEKWLMIDLLDLYFPATVEKLDWLNLGRPCATQRLFFPNRLKNVDSLIYLDTDIIFFRPVEELWSFFQKFNSTQLSALSYEHYSMEGWYPAHSKHPFYRPYGLNAGVMLMNLTRLRNMEWEKTLVSIRYEFKRKIPWGDQDILNIFFHMHREKLYVLPCVWNYRSDFCFYAKKSTEGICTEALENGISLLHGNKEIFNNYRHTEFKNFYEAVRDYNFVGDFKKNVSDYVQNQWRSFNKKKLALYCVRIAKASLEKFTEEDSI